MSIVIAIAGVPGIGKTTFVKKLIQQQIAQDAVAKGGQQSAQISPPAVYFCPGVGTVPIDLTCIGTEFPHVQILTEGQELQLIEQVDKGTTAIIELGFHLDLQSGSRLLNGLSENHSSHRVALVPSGLAESEWHSWADEVHSVECSFGLNQLQIWRSPLSGQVFDPASLNVFWYELTQGAYGEACRCKGIFELPDGRAFYIDFVLGMVESQYIPLNLPHWLEGRPARFSGIEVAGRNLDDSAIAQSITDCCLSDEVIAYYQQQIKQSLLVSV
jgi:hypothetical protein